MHHIECVPASAYLTEWKQAVKTDGRLDRGGEGSLRVSLDSYLSPDHTLTLGSDLTSRTELHKELFEPSALGNRLLSTVGTIASSVPPSMTLVEFLLENDVSAL